MRLEQTWLLQTHGGASATFHSKQTAKTETQDIISNDRPSRYFTLLLHFVAPLAAPDGYRPSIVCRLSTVHFSAFASRKTNGEFRSGSERNGPSEGTKRGLFSGRGCGVTVGRGLAGRHRVRLGAISVEKSPIGRAFCLLIFAWFGGPRHVYFA